MSASNSQPQDALHPLKVWMVCTGVGIMNRGIESFFRDCFDGLHPLAESNGIKLELFKGRGTETTDEHRVWCLPRTGMIARFAGSAIGRNGYVIEQLSSVIPVQRRICAGRPDVIFYSDCNLAFRLFYNRPKIGVPFRLVYSNGAPLHPPFVRCDHVQQVHPFYLQEAIDKHEDPARHSLVPYGFTVPSGAADFDPEYRTRMKDDLNLPKDRRIILSVGWIAAIHKRMDYLIRELAALPSPRPYLVMLGSMDEQSPPILEQAKQSLGAENFTARSVPYEQVSRYYQAADVFTLCSLVEGFGRVYVEALMHGLPCAVHDHPVMRYVLGDEGTYGDFTQKGALAAQLSRLVPQPLNVDDMRRRRETMRERFSWESLAPQYFQMFRTAASQPIRENF
jgi:glycosyltransferase involved in cell wall biosynthesis